MTIDNTIFEKLPEGFHRMEGTTTQPAGTYWACNGSAFITDENGDFTVNPNYIQVLVRYENW